MTGKEKFHYIVLWCHSSVKQLLPLPGYNLSYGIQLVITFETEMLQKFRFAAGMHFILWKFSQKNICIFAIVD